MRKWIFFSILILSLPLTGCLTEPVGVEEERHTIVEVFKLAPVSIHDEISPRYRAVLSNGDTIPVAQFERVGDTITYKYYHHVEKR